MSKLHEKPMKLCYSCDSAVRMTPAQYAADANEHTICARCWAVLTAQAREIGRGHEEFQSTTKTIPDGHQRNH